VSLTRLPGSRTDSRITAPSGRVADIDVKVLKDATPRAVAGLARQVTPTLVVADWLSPRSRDLLRANGTSYLDATGNAEIRLDEPALYIRTDGADRNPSPKPATGPRLRGPKAWALLRTIAEAPSVRRARARRSSRRRPGLRLPCGAHPRGRPARHPHLTRPCHRRRLGRRDPQGRDDLLALRLQRDLDLGHHLRARSPHRRPRLEASRPVGGHGLHRGVPPCPGGRSRDGGHLHRRPRAARTRRAPPAHHLRSQRLAGLPPRPDRLRGHHRLRRCHVRVNCPARARLPHRQCPHARRGRGNHRVDAQEATALAQPELAPRRKRQSA